MAIEGVRQHARDLATDAACLRPGGSSQGRKQNQSSPAARRTSAYPRRLNPADNEPPPHRGGFIRTEIIDQQAPV